MRLAPTCGLDVPALDFRRVLERDIYLIERFDRVPHSNWLDRRPFASGLTMLGAHESEVSRYCKARYKNGPFPGLKRGQSLQTKSLDRGRGVIGVGEAAVA
jgi:hypothetical protein